MLLSRFCPMFWWVELLEDVWKPMHLTIENFTIHKHHSPCVVLRGASPLYLFVLFHCCRLTEARSRMNNVTSCKKVNIEVGFADKFEWKAVPFLNVVGACKLVPYFCKRDVWMFFNEIHIHSRSPSRSHFVV